MVGHLIGLGDRHFDNMLIKMYTGHICHIDFECVLNNGEYLPIPEIVPFRLTRNLIDGLGVLQEEGLFMNNCVLIYDILRQNKSLLQSIFQSYISEKVYP